MQGFPLKCLFQNLAKAFGTNPTVEGVPGPIDHQGFSLQFFEIQKSPIPAVLAVFPVVAHHKQVAFGNTHRAKIIAGNLGVRSRQFPVIGMRVRIGFIVYK